MTDVRCVCGYPRSLHEVTGRCPLCACGKLPTEHVDGVCPGKPLTAAGNLPTLRRGSFREPAPDPPRREWLGMTIPMTESELLDRVAGAVPGSRIVAEPRVPARHTVTLDEIAPRALPLGNAAADRGWSVVPWYWQAGDGVETSALVMFRAELRAVAYWNRAPGASWKTGGARAWRDGEWPVAVPVTQLVKIIQEVG